MGGSARIGPDTYALFLSDITKHQIEVRTMSLDAPHQLSGPVETYRFDEVHQATVLLDEEANTWFMYYRGENEYGVKLAPAGELDTTPPTAPGSVIAMPASDREIDLSWSPATDPDTGIVLYEIFRDGNHLATVKGWSFTDTGLLEQTEYSYAVSAINYHGIKGPRSAPVTATTSVDVTPPRVVSVNASGSPNEVTMVFDKLVEGASAETPANYTIDQGISVTGATLHPDLRTVVLTTSAQRHCATYRVTVDNVRDRAQVPNVVAPDTTIRYTYSSVPGLVGAWTFDEGEGETAFDTANYGNDGALIYTDKSGPAWTAGKYGNGLQFDGIDDQVTIDGAGSLEDVTDQSYTFAAWARADSLPPNSTPNDPFYSVVVRNYTGLYFDHNGRFRAQIRLADDTEVAVSSEALDPGAWHHLAMVVDDMNKQLHLYFDGQEVHDSPVSYTGALADHEDAPYYIGTSEPLTERYEYRFKGKIDEPRIFDRGLSPSEVQVLFARSSGNPVCSLLWLPFVTICRDRSL
jgi:chitodextrinase